MDFPASFLNQRRLITTGFHLPYNPNLIERAKEMRKNPTSAEKKLWESFLKNFPYRVLRQRVIDHFIVDYYCPKLKLAIEVDGEIHSNKEIKQYDEQRTLFLKAYDLNVIRFVNKEVMEEFDKVCDRINVFLF